MSKCKNKWQVGDGVSKKKLHAASERNIAVGDLAPRILKHDSRLYDYEARRLAFGFIDLADASKAFFAGDYDTAADILFCSRRHVDAGTALKRVGSPR